MSEHILEIRHLSKTFGTHAVLKDIDFTVDKGDVTTIIGASGSGKSTLLRCINLLETLTTGEILFHGQDVSKGKINSSSYRAKVGMVFQNFNLFSNLTVLSNCMIGQQKVLKIATEEAKKRALYYLNKVGMAPYINARPDQISGGQKQRVAIARALANDPKVLLCDEATSALDPQTTRQILKLLRTLNEKLGITIVLITHEMAVVKEICSHVAVMDHGCVVEQGDVYTIFANPRMQITRNFIRTTSNLHKMDELIEERARIAELQPGELIIRLSYVERNVAEAVISQISRMYNVDVNILFANVEILQGSQLGGTVAIISGERADVTRAIEYFIEKNVGVEVLKDGRISD